MRQLKFRAWDKVRKKMYNPKGAVYCYETELGYPQIGINFDVPDQGFAGSNSFLDYKPILQQFTGLLDINGAEIFEGDIVVVYPDNYETTHIQDNIYEVDTAKPLPLKDIVLFKGTVEYNAPEFRVNVKENPGGVASISMNTYWLEVIGNIFDNPDLLK